VASPGAASKSPHCQLLPFISARTASGTVPETVGRRLTEEGFSHEDTMILSYASFGFDALEKTFGVESVLTNDLRMQDRYIHGFPRIEARFARMIRQLQVPYQQATLPHVVNAEELWAQIAL
jgi:hypothetical protein